MIETALKTGFQLKGGSCTLTVFKLTSTDLEAVTEQLKETVKKAPKFFQSTPIILDLLSLDSQQISLDLMGLVTLLRQNQLIPVGVRCHEGPLKAAATTIGLAIMPEPQFEEKQATNEKKTESVTRKTLVIDQPVRSGIQVYAKDSDLVVLNTVSPGAELLADGNIHIYGALYGRALAGLQGQTDAHIFCRTLEAELIAIAGHYLISEQIPTAAGQGPMTHLFLQGKQIKVETL